MKPDTTDATLPDLAVGSDRRLPRWSTPDLDAYCLSAPREDRDFMRAQQMDAHAKNGITCRCGFRRWIGFAFRCFYCGEWMCMACAEAHFGKTLHQWREEKRVQLRREIEERKECQRPASQEASGTGSIQSRPFPARTGNVMESAGHASMSETSAPTGATGSDQDPAAAPAAVGINFEPL